jgi:hypothetical protein
MRLLLIMTLLIAGAAYAGNDDDGSNGANTATSITMSNR